MTGASRVRDTPITLTGWPEIVPPHTKQKLKHLFVHPNLERRLVAHLEVLLCPVPQHWLLVVQEEAAVLDRRLAVLQYLVTGEGDVVVRLDGDVGPPVPWRDAHEFRQGVESVDRPALDLSTAPIDESGETLTLSLPVTTIASFRPSRGCSRTRTSYASHFPSSSEPGPPGPPDPPTKGVCACEPDSVGTDLLLTRFISAEPIVAAMTALEVPFGSTSL